MLVSVPKTNWQWKTTRQILHKQSKRAAVCSHSACRLLVALNPKLGCYQEGSCAPSPMDVCCCHSPRARLSSGQALRRPELVLCSWICFYSWIGFLTKALNQKLDASANAKEWIHALDSPLLSNAAPTYDLKHQNPSWNFSRAVSDTALS